MLEVNPRASRTVPFVSKATGAAARQDRGALHGRPVARDAEGRRGEVVPPYFSVKEAVFPFNKFPGVDPILGPEMRSTGEVMGVGRTFGEAFLKCQLARGLAPADAGTVCITVQERRQAARGRGRARPRRARLPARRDARHGGRDRARRACRCTPSTRSRKAGRTSST